MTDKTFNQEVAAGVKGRTALLRDTRAEIIRLLKLAQQQIAIILASQPSDYQRWSLPQLQKEIARVLAQLGDSSAAAMSSAAGQAWQAGLDLVDKPIRAAGAAHITASLGTPDIDQLNAMRAFMTHRIRDISVQVANKINTELGLVVIGAQNQGDAIGRVQDILGDASSKRATTIVRTELGRVFSAASFARMQQAVAAGANIRKKWIKSGKVHSRPGHDAIHGQILPVDEPFNVLGKDGTVHQLMYPHDPKAPASETINCGCVVTPTASGFEGAPYKSMVGKPDGGQWSKDELRARARAFAASKRLSPGWGLPPEPIKEAYDPSQPRNPKGSAGGGQWAKSPGSAEANLQELLQAKIAAFAQRAFYASNQHEVLPLGPVDNHALIRSSTGFEVAGYNRILDNFGIRHTFKIHGSPATETPRGQRAVVLEDFSRIPEIVAHPDLVEYVGKSRVSKADLIRFTKSIDGETYHYVEEIRRKRRVLATETLWISARKEK